MTDTRFEEFHKAVAPTVQVMRDLTNAIMAVEPRHKHRPEQGSEGAGELDFQEVIEKKTSWDKPITDTHSMGGVALLAATDYARGFAELFDGKRTPVFGHLALARAALEAATVAGWLNEAGIDPLERVRRGLWEQVKSAWELAEAARGPTVHDDPATAQRKQSEHDASQRRKQRWEAVAGPFGWDIQGHKGMNPKIVAKQLDGNGRPKFATGRPWPGIGIDELLLGDVLGPRAHDLGRTQWSYLGGVGHVVWFAMREAVMEPPASDREGPWLAGFGTNLYSALMQALCVTRAVRLAATRRFQMMGWTDSEWLLVYQNTERYEATLLNHKPT